VLSGEKFPLNCVHDVPPVIRLDLSQFNRVVPRKTVA